MLLYNEDKWVKTKGEGIGADDPADHDSNSCRNTSTPPRYRAPTTLRRDTHHLHHEQPASRRQQYQSGRHFQAEKDPQIQSAQVPQGHGPCS